MRGVQLGVFVLLCGCAEGISADTGVNPGLGGDTGVMEDGQLWCARVPNALAFWIGGQFAPIEDPDDGLEPKGCLCANAGQDSDLDAIAAMTGDAEVTSSDGNELLQFRNGVFEQAEETCETEAPNTMLPGLGPPDATPPHNCETQIDRDETDMSDPLVTPLFEEGQFGDCVAGEDFGDTTGLEAMPPDNWDDYYILSTAVVYNGSTRTYEVDEDFFDDLVATPAWLLNDKARVEFRDGDYTFRNVATDTIVYALGIRTDDEPLTLNGKDITTVEDALATYQDLKGSTSFTLVVKRGSSNTTLSYVVQ